MDANTMNGRADGLLGTTLKHWSLAMLSAIGAGMDDEAARCARRAHAVALVLDESLRHGAGTLVCPQCGAQCWKAYIDPLPHTSAVILTRGADDRLIAADYLNPPTFDGAREEHWSCEGCGLELEPGMRIWSCPKDETLVLEGWCCPACGVDFSDPCNVCDRAGYHADDCHVGRHDCGSACDIATRMRHALGAAERGEGACSCVVCAEPLDPNTLSPEDAAAFERIARTGSVR